MNVQAVDRSIDRLAFPQPMSLSLASFTLLSFPPHPHPRPKPGLSRLGEGRTGRQLCTADGSLDSPCGDQMGLSLAPRQHHTTNWLGGGARDGRSMFSVVSS